MNLCECGCGQVVKNRFVNGHNVRMKGAVGRIDVLIRKRMEEGRGGPNKGVKFPDEWRNNISKGRKGIASQLGKEYVERENRVCICGCGRVKRVFVKLKWQFFIGHTNWNKGLTKETDGRVRRYGESGAMSKKGKKNFWLEEQNEQRKGRTYEEIYGSEKAIEIKKKIVSSTLLIWSKGLSSYEKRLEDLIKKYKLNYKYTGSGKDVVIIGGKVPDFMNVNSLKVVLEVYSKSHLGEWKPLNYEESRRKHFVKYGFKVIFFNEDDLFRDNWEVWCIRKLTVL